MFEHYHTFNVF